LADHKFVASAAQALNDRRPPLVYDESSGVLGVYPLLSQDRRNCIPFGIFLLEQNERIEPP
jgi:hypothetical protein